MEKLLPQPHFDLNCLFKTLKPAEVKLSSYDSSDPFRNKELFLSIKTRVSPAIMIMSLSSGDSAHFIERLKPEQPPPWTAILKPCSLEGRSSRILIIAVLSTSKSIAVLYHKHLPYKVCTYKIIMEH